MTVSVTSPPHDPPREDVAGEAGTLDSVANSASSVTPAPEARTRRHRWLRWLIIFSSMVLVLGAAGSGTAYYLARKAVSDIPTVDLSRGTLADRGGAMDPVNFLLIGSDSRLEVEENYGSGVEGQRSDTIMIAQLDPRRDKGVIVSIPRDTRVDIPRHGPDKINAAYSIGGVQLAVDTVKEFTNLPIHHYIEINFDGFSEVVDAVGGVDICVDQPIRDAMSGLDLREAGCHHLSGEFALAYARSRSPQLFEDGKWREDTAGDFGRIQRQQTFLRALMKRAIGVNAIARWKELSKAVKKGVRIDEGLDFDQFFALYSKFADMTPDKVEMLSVPGTTEMIKGVSYVIAKEPDTANLFRTLGAARDNQSTGPDTIEISPAMQVQVKVLNGTSTMGLAANAAALLKEKGFFVVGTGDTKYAAQTEIRYEPSNEAKARAVRDALGVGIIVVSKQPIEGDVVVYLGKDYIR